MRIEGKRTKETTGKDIQDGGKLGGEWKFEKKPNFLKERVAYFDKLLAEQNERFAQLPV